MNACRQIDRTTAQCSLFSPSSVLCSYQHLQTSFSLGCGLQERSLMHKANKQLITVTCGLRKILPLSSRLQSHCFYEPMYSSSVHFKDKTYLLCFFFLPPSNGFFSTSSKLLSQLPETGQISRLPPSTMQGQRSGVQSKLHQSVQVTFRQTLPVEWKRKQRLQIQPGHHYHPHSP